MDKSRPSIVTVTETADGFQLKTENANAEKAIYMLEIAKRRAVDLVVENLEPSGRKFSNDTFPDEGKN